MKKLLYPAIAAMIGCTSLSTQAVPPAQLHSGLSDQPDVYGTPIDALEQHMSTGKFAILPWVIGISSIDLALIGVYWGIYVPNYADTDPEREQLLPEEAAE